MSYVKSPEYLLYQLGLSFGLTAEKKKENVEKLAARRGSKAEQIAAAAMDVVAREFELDENARRDLQGNLQSHLPLYLNLEAGIWTFGTDQKLVDWTLANHIYIPIVARMMAFWYLDESNDVGMPEGKFWYLPESGNGSDNALILPVANVVNWLLDLLGSTPEGLVERRSDELRDSKIGADIYDGDEEGDLAQALYKWKSSKNLPKLETIEKYFPDGMQDSFFDALKLDSNLELDEQFERTIAFCGSRRNKLTPVALSGEIDMRASEGPLSARLAAIFEGTASDEEKKRFITQMVRRYQAPNPRTVRQRLKLARASQDIYLRCKKYFSEAKAKQLIELYKLVYNLTIDAEKTTSGPYQSSWQKANENFSDSLGPFSFGVLSLFSDFDENLAPVFLKNRFTRIFIEADDNPILPDFFSPEGRQRGVEWRLQDKEIEDTLTWYAQALDRRSIVLEVEAVDELWRLMRITRDNRIDDTIRHAATERLDDLTKGTRLSGMGLVGRLEMARDAGDEVAIERIRTQILGGGTDQAHSPHLNIQLGIHALSTENFEAAQKHFLKALSAGKGNISGDMRGELSLHLWSLRRHLKQKANPSQELAWEKDIKLFAFERNELWDVPPKDEWYAGWCRAYLG